MTENLTIYKGKKVFVTGHTGFKGSWLISWLYLLGANIKGYALAPENDNDLYHIINGDTLCNSVVADVRDEQRLTKELLAFKPDFIFHLAAQPLVRFSYKKPTETFATNVIGTANLLNATRLLDNACTVVVITTDKVYENKEWNYPYREIDTLGGYDPYSASKACTEIVVNSFRQSFFNTNEFAIHKKSVATARAGNVIGGGDWSEDRIIPDIIRKLNQGSKIGVRNPLSIRPWQFVLEPIYGYLLLGSVLSADPSKFSGAFNFGPLPDDELSVEELTKQAIFSWGAGTYEFPEQKNQPHEAGILKLDISKSIKLLGWKPNLDSSEAIKWTIEWYKQMKNSNFTFDQIKNYEALV